MTMCWSLLPMTAFADATEYDLWVNGEQFTSEKLTVKCGDGTAKFDPELGELTLTDATITTPYFYGDAFASGIFTEMENDLSINVNGTNTIDLSKAVVKDDINVLGVTGKNVGIGLVGDGTLNIDLGIDRKNTTCPIYSETEFRINGASLNCKAADYGICADDSLRIKAKHLTVATRSNNKLLSSDFVNCDYTNYEILVSDNAEGTGAKKRDGARSLYDYHYMSMELVAYYVWVNGEQFKRDDREIKCGNGTATYNPDKKELVLENATITDCQYFCGIYAEGALNVVTKGTNVINLVDSEDISGIAVNSDLTISGDGTLDISVSDIYAYSISSGGNLTIDMTGDLTVTDGLYVNCDLSILGSGDVSIIDYDAGDAIYANNGTVSIIGSGDVTIDVKGRAIDCEKVIIDMSGKLNITSGYGIDSDSSIEISGSGDIEMNSSTGLYSSDMYGIADISGSGKMTINSGSYGIDVNAGNVKISGSRDINITAAGGYGIRGGGGIILSTDGDIIINADYDGLSTSGNVDISGNGTVTVSSNCASAVEVGEDGIVALNGKNTEVSFTTTTTYYTECAVSHSMYTEENLVVVAGKNFDKYDVKGAPSEKSVVYSLRYSEVTFDMGGHGNAIDKQIVIDGEKVEKPSDPTADKWAFVGWYSDKECTKAFDFNTVITENTTLYAKWTCAHKNTEVRGVKDASLTAEGYTGDTYCTDCGEKIASGKEIPSLSTKPTPTIPPTTPTPAPELNVGDFVDRCYEVALGREADKEGYEYWVSNLNNGQACGAQVGFGFIFSAEYVNKNTTNEQFVTDMYSMFFGREADEAGYNYWLEQLNNGTATREQVFAGFANSEEFYNLCNRYGVVSGYYAVGVPNEQQGGVNCFVARLYKVCLNRLPDMGGQAGWVMKLMNGEVSGTTCAYGFVFSPEFITMNLDNVNFVNYMYKAFFGREADQDGLNYWVEQLDNGTATREDIFAGFSGSAEFANLCASYGISA